MPACQVTSDNEGDYDKDDDRDKDDKDDEDSSIDTSWIGLWIDKPTGVAWTQGQCVCSPFSIG